MSLSKSPFSEIHSPILRENLSHLNVFTSPNSSTFVASKDKENQPQFNQKAPCQSKETPLLESEITSIKKKLQVIFSFYSSFGDRKNLKLLKSNKFHKMMSDSGLKDSNLSQKRLDLLFMAESQHRPHISFEIFLKLLIKVACYKYSMDESQALKRILQENFEPLYQNILSETDLGFEKQQFSQEISPIILEFLQTLTPILSRIYLAYFPWEPKSFQSFSEISKRSESSLFIFLKDFDICPSILTKSKTFLLYNEVLSLSKEEIRTIFFGEEIGTIFTYWRFLLFLIRVALCGNSENSQEISMKNLLERMELSSGFMNLEKRLNIPFNAKLSLRILPQKDSCSEISEKLVENCSLMENSVKNSEEIKQLGDYEEPVKRIFQYYCAMGEPLNTKYLKSIKLKRFLKEIGLFTAKFDQNYVDLLFVKLKGKNGKMEFDGFIKALELISSKLRPDIDQNSAFSWLIESYFLDFSEKILQFKNQTEEKPENYVQLLMDLLQDNEILDLLGTVHKSLKFYYEAYANPHGLLSFDSFGKFAKDFEIFPAIMTKSKLLKIFETLASVFQRTEAESPETQGFIDQHLFIEGLALCALEVNYQEPGPSNFEKVYYFLEKINQSDGLAVIQRRKGSGLKAQNWDLLQEYRRKTMGNSSMMNRSRSSGISVSSLGLKQEKSLALDFEALLRK